VEGDCSIYEDRPQTCRDFDCRIFAATGISVDEERQPEIAQRVKAWAFDYGTEESREQHAAVKQAAEFLQRNKDLFPPRSFPAYAVQLAALAVRIYRLFRELAGNVRSHGAALSDAAIAQAVVAALRELQGGGDANVAGREAVP
jgi:hypothetical protein